MPGDTWRKGGKQPDRRAGQERRSGEERRAKESRLGRRAKEPLQSRANRRHHRRHAVSSLRLGGPVTGEVVNTSHLGMAIQTNESLTVGWSYAFRMRHGHDVIRIPGKVCWCRLVQLLRIEEDEFLPVFRMGIQLAGNIWAKPQPYYYP